MDKAIKEIYTSLSDDLSKTIFENRLLFSHISDYKFIDNIIDAVSKNDGKNISDFLNFGKVVVYGADAMGVRYAAYHSDNILAFCDKNIEKQKMKICNKPVISPAELKDKFPNATIVITTVHEMTAQEIKNELIGMGFLEKDINIVTAFQCARDGVKLFVPQYFDNTIIPASNKNEVFVDAGCLNFSTSLDFIKWCDGEYKKIVAFEPNPAQHPICIENANGVKNAEIYQKGVWHENAELCFSVGVHPGGAKISLEDSNEMKISTVSIDNVLNGEEATFIKMDVEGAELNALKGARETILRYKPKLAICVYHKPEDIWEIPSYILSLNSSYKLYLRHYSLVTAETVLYAV